MATCGENDQVTKKRQKFLFNNHLISCLLGEVLRVLEVYDQIFFFLFGNIV
jgi:hypothetical protein